MSESDDIPASEGLQKLTDYLNQTRRQAAQAIDILNQRITELTTENDDLMIDIDRLRTERDHFHALSEQRATENAKKYRFKERDEWKALVESIQKDRSRLHEECNRLELALEEMTAKASSLEAELVESRARGLSEDSVNNRRSSSVSFDAMDPAAVADPPAGIADTPLKVPRSESLEEGRNGTATPKTPRSMAKRLQSELMNAKAQLDLERKLAESEIEAQQTEIQRLKTELNSVRRGPSGEGSTQRALTVRTNGSASAADQGWFGILSYIFPIVATPPPIKQISTAPIRV
jgi:chromosome segregation ATPase